MFRVPDDDEDSLLSTTNDSFETAPDNAVEIMDPQDVSMSDEQAHGSTPPTQSQDSSQFLITATELNSMINNAITAAINARSLNGTPSSKKKVSKLPEYDGKPSEWESWYTQAKIKLNTDGALIGTPQDQFGYIFSRLRGTAASATLAYTRDHLEKQDGDGHKLLEHMDTFFGDPAKEDRAIAQLQTLRQGKNELFSQFLPKFEALLADAGGADWAPKSQISYLSTAISDDLRQHCIGKKRCGTFNEYKELLLTIASDVEADRAIRQFRNKGQANTGFSYLQSGTPSRGIQGADAMDWELTGPARMANQRRNVNNCGCTGAHSCGRKRATWVF